jgi:mRNA interferase HigB
MPGIVPLALREFVLSPVVHRQAPLHGFGRALSPLERSSGLCPQDVYNAERPAFGVSIVQGSSHVAHHLILRYSGCMHIISRKTLRQFWEQHPDSESALARWFKIVQQNDFTSFETLRATFPTADKVGDLIVFNIGGNKYRLITAIHFNRRKVYIRHVLTHQEYDRGAWKV